MWLSKIGGSCSKSISTGNSVGLGIVFKSNKDIEINIDSKSGIESKN